MLPNEIARKNIKKYRKLKKLSQKQFAEALDVTHSSVSAWEIGKNSVDLNRLNQICQILDVSLYEMIFDREEPSSLEISEELNEIVETVKTRPEINELLRVSRDCQFRDVLIATRILQELKNR